MLTPTPTPLNTDNVLLMADNMRQVLLAAPEAITVGEAQAGLMLTLIPFFRGDDWTLEESEKYVYELSQWLYMYWLRPEGKAS